MRVAVIGQGYVGLVTAACLGEWGHEVVGIDADAAKMARLQAGQSPIREPGLDELIERHLDDGLLHFSSDIRAVSAAQLVMVAVGTTDADGGWQTGTMRAALNDVVPLVSDDGVLAIRSTLPPEFVRQLPAFVGAIREANGLAPIPVMLNPEFTRESTAVSDFLTPDRVVIGIASDPSGRGLKVMRRLYHEIDAPVVVLKAVDACLAKLASNLFLATKISFANEMAALCDAFGGTVDEVVAAVGLDPRIGPAFLRAGIGFGGSCLPHQVRMVSRMGDALGIQTPLISAVHQVNERQRTQFVDRLREQLGGSLAGRRIALLGLTFKPNTDDLREAPALTIAELMLAEGAEVCAYDPAPGVYARVAAILPGLYFAPSWREALDGADAVGLVTEWPELVALDWEAAAGLMRQRIVVDGRNVLSVARLVDAGFTYVGFGRGVASLEDGVGLAGAAIDHPAPSALRATMLTGARPVAAEQ